MQPDVLARAMQLAIAAALAPRSRILSSFRSADLRAEAKADGSPVTAADRDAERIVRDTIRGSKEFAAHAILGEEGGLEESASIYRWIIDPIDGTRAFINGRTDWSISVALVEDGRPIVGPVFAPNEGELFVATAGKGATCNGIPLRATPGDALEGARIAGPRRILDQLVALNTGIVAEPRIHSLALRLARVAQGELDAAVAGGNAHDWDLAAADLLVHEAGGALTTFAGQSLIYNQPYPVHPPLIAAGPKRRAALLALMQDHPVSR